MSNLKELQADARGLSILYVEDNEALRKHAGHLLEKFFSKVDLAEDGQVGLEFFKKHHYSLVITDIRMPNMDGMTLIKHIKQINPETKSIIMSAFDDKDLLMQGIELGVFRFLKKPVNVTELSDILHEAIKEIKDEQHKKIFYSHLKSIFDYQSSMIVMLNDTKIVLANENFLEFFTYESISECQKSMGDIGKHFLEHDGFLYNHDAFNAVQTIRLNEQKLYHVKLKNNDGEIKHLIAKYQDVPEKPAYGVLSFDDVTELNLLKLFDAKQNNIDNNLADTKSMFSLLEAIQRNSAKIELHNYYNGLSITNCGVIINISDDTLTLKTTYMQQKAIQLERKTLIVSSALPYIVECLEVQKISFEKQEVELKALRFVKTSPITRSTIRVVPKTIPSVSLFMGGNKFHGDVSLEDISLNAVKLKLNSLPAGLSEDSNIILDIVLELDKKPLIINTKATMFKIIESKHNFYIVFMFKDLKKNYLVNYITKRQMELIREIKGMQNG